LLLFLYLLPGPLETLAAIGRQLPTKGAFFALKGPFFTQKSTIFGILEGLVLTASIETDGL
jgi:hypothetical protein